MKRMFASAASTPPTVAWPRMDAVRLDANLSAEEIKSHLARQDSQANKNHDFIAGQNDEILKRLEEMSPKGPTRKQVRGIP